MKIIFGAVSLLVIFNYLFFKTAFVLGPFHLQNIVPDLISDFGGLSGVGIFILLLALIGLTIAWKKTEYLFSYLFLFLLIPVYLYNTETIFLLSILIIFFATASFIRLFESSWKLATLKKFTFFLLILGIVFSSLTYLDRVTENSPSLGDFETLNWIKENLPGEQVVFSVPENSYFISYFAQKIPFQELHLKEGQQAKENITQTIFNSTYTTITFPILEEHQISIIYITKDIKTKYPLDQGLLFLLKNERFKLVHSYEGAEVWVFNKN